MDPLNSLDLLKDSSLAMMRETLARGFEVISFTIKDLFALQGVSYGWGSTLTLDANLSPHVIKREKIELSTLDLILMRKDPPVDQEYMYACFVLEQAQTRVANNPKALLALNEKAMLQQFPSLTPPTLMTRSMDQIKEFLKQHHKIVVKPMGQMGGKSVFIVDEKDPNRNVILETITALETQTVIAQTYLPEIKQGDQRILIFHGEPAAMKVVRVPSAEDHRGNLAAGATSHLVPLNDHQKKVCEHLKPFFKENDLSLVGLDMIGNLVTEINITSPTCFRDLENENIPAAAQYLKGFSLFS